MRLGIRPSLEILRLLGKLNIAHHIETFNFIIASGGYTLLIYKIVIHLYAE